MPHPALVSFFPSCSVATTVRVLALLATAVLVAALTPSPAPAEDSVMQCMEKCVIQEGGNTATNRTTCKLRCANIAPATGAGAPAGGMRDCMGEFKACDRACAADQACKQACKQKLMGCV